ncbi:Phosphatases II [Mycena chlorophos]|uniref:protein-tyrosine-phosphatase n=1 Tax=Mycena chlorophos TaxID=658473 RepID=A0A8H6TUQ8_MYCCL|nr:Phosphatases II [Mycena chlorophos]
MASPSLDAIVPGQLYLSNLPAAQSASLREASGITHIVSVCTEYPSTGPKHLVIPVNDCEYDDLLIHLPEACSWIDNALAEGGRVLIHCLMGVSRSTTVLAAYLMKTRHLSPTAALSLIRKRRPCVQPNYGFLKQLDVFQACDCAPSTTHPCYRSWKRKHRQDAGQFLNYFQDTAAVIPKKLFLCSEFPDDSLQADLLLYELEITHFLTISPASYSAPATSSAPLVTHHYQHKHIDVPDHLLCLPTACASIRDALSSGGRVLVHSQLESRACAAVGAYLMTDRAISAEAATKVIRDALPLFDPSPNFMHALTSFQPTSTAPPIPRSPTRPSRNDAELMVQTAASLMSESGIDLRAFSDALVTVSMKQKKQQAGVDAPSAALTPASKQVPAAAM